MQTSTLTGSTTNTISTIPALSEGKKIAGCYILRKNLSGGGVTSVWLATDEVLGKDVTLHFVPPAVAADERAMAELRQEVKKNRQLIHPNILRVYDFVEDGDCAAISMDKFEGESLAEILRNKGRLDPADVKPWLAQLAETLGDAHRIHLFHRDLSPCNLFRRPSGSLLMANFGLSRATFNALERAGLAKGTEAHLAYLSPQQIDGEKPAATDDVYGFGVMIYELLAGSPPFGGDDLIPKIRKEIPPPVSDVRAKAGASPIPASWEKAIAACLAKHAEQRPRNLTEVVAMMAHESADFAPKAPVAAPAARPEAGQGTRLGSKEEISKAAGADLPRQGISHADEPKPGADSVVEGRNGNSGGFVTREKQQEKPAGVSESPGRPEGPPAPPKTMPRKPPTKGALSANFPDLDRPRSKAPLVWLTLLAVTIGALFYWKNRPDDSEVDDDGSVARIETDTGPIENPPVPPPSKPPIAPDGKQPDLPDPVPVKPGIAINEPPTTPGTPPPKVTRNPLISSDTSPVSVPAVPSLVPDDLATASDGHPPKPPIAVKPAPTPTPREVTPAPGNPPVAISLPKPPPELPKLALSAKATPAELDAAKKERENAIEKVRSTAAAAEAARKETALRLESATAEQDRIQKSLESRRKALSPVIQETEAIEAARKKLEESMTKAEAAATEAAKAAEAARKTYQDAVTKGAERLRARQQAEDELRDAASQLAERKKEADDLSQLVAKADALRQEMRLAEEQISRDLEKISTASDKTRQAEMELQHKANQEKIASLEKQIQDLQAQLGRLNAALGPLKELGEAGKEAASKIAEKATAVTQQIAETQSEIKRLSAGRTPPPPRTENVAKPTPAPSPASAAAANSLGMTFAPVGDVQFSVHLTTRKDFEAFATATGLKSEAWRNPGFKQDADHPVVNVTWREAEAFCKWLTDKERKAGLLKQGEVYRLPTDLEWSKAVGLPAEAGANPEERDMSVQDVYPWGTHWPPPAGAGNYAGEETQTEIPIPNYNDGYPNTSPVGKFKANALGLFDMGGNVWQWVGDYWNGENRAKALRGGSWYNGAIPLSLLSSCRISSSPDTLHDTYGFRAVKAAESPKGKRR